MPKDCHLAPKPLFLPTKRVEKENTKLKDELKTKGKEIERVNNEVTKHQKNGKIYIHYMLMLVTKKKIKIN